MAQVQKDAITHGRGSPVILVVSIQALRPLTALAFLLHAGSVFAGAATINIEVSNPGPRINPRLFGIFLEEINFGVDGGLYAELIRNRGFEDAKPPEGFTLKNGRWLDEKGYDARFSRFGYVTNGLPSWTLVKEGLAEGSMHLDMESPLSPATPRSLRLEIQDVSSGRLGVANEGFWGIGVTRGERYDLSFWARCADGFTGPLTALLESADGAACSEPQTIKGIGTKWKKFTTTLTSTRDESKARFVLTAGSRGKVWLDMVSLFPAKTFKGHGLRPDLARMLADLRPGFVRFPGGCVVEGGTIETAYNWKKTIGPLEQREEVWGPWNYRRTHGMGFHEYLQFCEDIGSEPLYVGFAGETCMFREAEDVPMAEMGWVVTNFVDAIEYANGSPATKWGKLRAQQGHAKPFGLKMVEVGNENGTQQFPQRYRLVHSALKERYPELNYIADLSFPRFMRKESFDMEDNHFYNSPQWFMNNVHHYDDRDRKLPPVYDGEVAVTSSEGGRDKGNVIAALGEGAFLMGLERNADVVRQVSYAPLLANVRGRTDWHGMIYFDTTRAFGTVSYYLWKLFAENRPTFTVKTGVEVAAENPKPIAGGIGVGTWNTSAEYKDIQVEKNGQVLFASDFSKPAEGWQTEGGRWSVVDGAYRQSDQAVGVSFFGDKNWSDYTLTLKARKLSGAEGFLVAFGRKGEDRNWWNIGGWGNQEHGIEFNQNGIGRRVPGMVEANRWYDIKVELAGRRLRCYLDGKLIHDEIAASPNRFFALAGRDEKSGELVVKAINAGSEPISATLKIEGASRLAAEASMTVLKSERGSDNNSLENPTRVAPVASTIAIAGSTFNHDFPGYSLTVLRVGARVRQPVKTAISK
jgi:alpha-L-arabinofuranosidase